MGERGIIYPDEDPNRKRKGSFKSTEKTNYVWKSA